MLVYDHLKCPFCGTLNKFIRGNGRELDKFKCFYCHSWFEKQNDNEYIAVNDRNETEAAGLTGRADGTSGEKLPFSLFAEAGIRM